MKTIFVVCVVLTICILCPLAISQVAGTQNSTAATTLSIPLSSDPQAVTLIQEALSALTGGTSLTDISLSTNAVWIAGSTNVSGTAILKAKGTGESRLDISAADIVRTEIRNDAIDPGGEWIGSDGVSHKMALHNSQNIAGWFSPASVISGMSGAAVLQYIGSETRNGLAVDHVRFFRQAGNYKNPSDALLFQKLSQTEVYLDASSHLPVAISWNAHPDQDYVVNFPMEIRLAGYQSFTGVAVPSRIQRLLNGSLNLDLTVTSVQINSGIPDSAFALQ